MKLIGNLRGIIAMCFAMAFFIMNDIFVKLAAATWPVHQILIIRGIMASTLVFCFILCARQHSNLRDILHPLVIARGLVECFVAYAFITALITMPLADVTSILMISPLVITAAGAFFFQEDVRWRRWMAIAVGFVGMLLVVRPGGSDFSFATILAILSAFGVAGRDILTRMIPKTIPSLMMTLSSTVSVMLAGIGITFVQPLAAYDEKAMIYCCGAAVTVALGNYATVMAFRDVDVSVVAPFRYTLIIWAVLGGYIVFGNGPAPVAWLGIFLIVASGLYTMYREKLIRKGI